MDKDTKPTGTAVVTWKEKMAAVVAQAAEMEAPKGGFLSFKGGNMSYDDNPIPGNKLSVVVIDFLIENAIFKSKYNPNVPQSPMCYAFGRVEDELKPHPDASEPQHTDCASCPNNEWASNPEGGRGKACKNSRRIAIITSDCLESVEKIRKANVVMCKIPATSLKNFSTYVNQVTKVLEKHPFQVITELSAKPHPANMFEVVWKVTAEVMGDDIQEALYNKYMSIQKQMSQPYPANEEEAAPAPTGKASKKY